MASASLAPFPAWGWTLKASIVAVVATATPAVARAFRRDSGARAVAIAVTIAGATSLACGSVHSEQALWRTDGTPAGTAMVTTLPERVSSSWSPPVAVGGELFFLLNDGSRHVELWKSDGTAAGTRLVSALPPGSDRTGRGRALEVGGRLYFVYEDEAHGAELWQSDGTAAGTSIVRDLVPGPQGSWPTRLWRVGERVVFFAGFDHGSPAPLKALAPGLWSSDGTADGTVLLQAGALNPDGSTAVGDEVFFLAGEALWRSDGTPAGTRRVQPLPLTADRLCSVVGGDAYASNAGLFALDRARLRTGAAEPLRRVAPLPELCPAMVVDAGDLVYFVSYVLSDPQSRRSELWRSDGTAAGTFRLRASDPPGFGALTVVGSRVFFSASTPETGSELWTTDGTAESTALVVELEPGPESGVEEHATALGGKLLFSGTRGLWTTDGTAKGTVRIERGLHFSDFALLDSRAYWLMEQTSVR